MTHILAKLDKDKKQVSGFAYVSTVDGDYIPDHSGEIIKTATLEVAAHKYLHAYGFGKTKHTGPDVMHIINSIMFTKEIQADLGIDLGREGWYVTMQVTDDTVWEELLNGDYEMFSVGGFHK